MNSIQDNKDKPLTRPILKLNLGASKSLPEAALQKIEKLKSQDQMLKAKEENKLPKEKGKATQAILKVNDAIDLNKNLKIKKAKEVIESQERINIEEPTKEKQKSKPKKWLLLHPTEYQKMLKEFRTDFPNCFSKERKPLALDIRQALIDIKPEYTSMQIATFLKIYCRGALYKEKLILGAERVSLNGEVHSLVSEEQLTKGRNRISEKSKHSKKLVSDNLNDPKV